MVQQCYSILYISYYIYVPPRLRPQAEGHVSKCNACGHGTREVACKGVTLRPSSSMASMGNFGMVEIDERLQAPLRRQGCS